MTVTIPRCADSLPVVLAWPFPATGPPGPGFVVATARRQPGLHPHLKDPIPMIEHPVISTVRSSLNPNHRHFLTTARTEAASIGAIAKEGLALVQTVGSCLAAMALGAALLGSLDGRKTPS